MFCSLKLPSTNIIMCPSHLMEKWKREIDTYMPLSLTRIVSSFDDFTKLEPLINDPKRSRHLFLILSKETAKFGYDRRPAAVWHQRKRGYICPDCGQPLYKSKLVGSGRHKYYDREFFGADAFRFETEHNLVCMNKKRKWHKKSKSWMTIPCKASLWQPMVRPLGLEDKTPWIRLSSSGGWIEQRMIDSEIARLSQQAVYEKIDSKYLIALTDTKAKIEVGDEDAVRAPRKYPLAKYIKERYQDKIDFVLFDEAHELKGEDTSQGVAFGQLSRAAKKTLCLTGTLVNGYANGIFYLLYRIFASQMKQEGFDWEDSGQFQSTYGVTEKTTRWSSSTSSGGRTSKSTERSLPGVSPLVFTQFLLENAVFVELSDMADGLPGYREIPYPVEMDLPLANAYSDFQRQLRHAVCSPGGRKVMGKLYQSLSVYPDQPYDQPPVIHPDTGAIVATPETLPQVARNKEDRLVDLVNERIAAGDKVMVYFNWTHTTDCMQRVEERLQQAGLNVAKLTANTSGANARRREAWIENQVEEGAQVLLTNPELVKTGLDLLPFTSIIFYQLGNNLYTMRQASRRSWRLSQNRDVRVYFMYYRGTVQENATGLMATKLQAAMSLEGKFSEEGLQAMSSNEDFLTQIANSVVNGALQAVDEQVFEKTSVAGGSSCRTRRAKYVSPITQRVYSALSGKPRKKVKTMSGLFGMFETKLQIPA
jgi:hypothetical protein